MKVKDLPIGERVPVGRRYPRLYVRRNEDDTITYLHRDRRPGVRQWNPLQAQTLQAAEREQHADYPSGKKRPKAANINTKFSDDLWDLFLEEITNAGTKRAYKGVWYGERTGRIVQRYLHHKRPEDIEPEVVLKITAAMKEAGYAQSTIARVEKAISRFYTWAREEGYATHNPCRDIPKKKKVAFGAATPVTPDAVFSEEEIVALSQAALERSARGRIYATLFTLAPDAGGRIGEMLGIQWTNVNGRWITLEKQVDEKFDPADPDTWFCALKGDENKTKGRNRRVEIPAEAAAMLTAYRTWLLEQGLHRPDGFVFPSSNHTPLQRETVRLALLDCAERAGITRPVKFHHFRHTCASRMFANGESTADVGVQLGDDEETVKETYIHLHDDAARLAKKDALRAERKRLLG